MAPEDGLELIPRSVRDKLDRVGLKIHLRDWEKLSLDERVLLRDRPCESPDEIASYRSALVEMVRRRTGGDPEPLSPS